MHECLKRATIQTRPDQTRPDQTRPDQTVNYDLLYDPEYQAEAFRINHFINKKLTFRIIQDGYILPYTPQIEGGIFDSEGSYISESSLTDDDIILSLRNNDYSNTDIAAVASKQNIDISDTLHRHSKTIYVGCFIGIWGHMITDSMRLLWFLNSQEYHEQFADYELAYLPARGFKLDGNYKRLLEILGIKTSLLTPVTRLTKYDKIILPDECFFTPSDGITRYTREYIESIDNVRNYAEANSRPVRPRKIYYSYRLASKGRAIGEDKLEKYLALKGYEIVFPEKYSIDEQLNMLINCNSFASTIGSCSHNSLFLRDNTEVILIPRADYLTGYQVAIDQVHKQNIHYVDSSFSIFVDKSPWGGPFLYFISSNLRKYFHDEDTESIVYPSDFWRYLRSSLGLSLGKGFGGVAGGNNSKVYRYYSTTAADYFGKLFAQAKLKWPYRLRMWLKKLLRRQKPTP